MENLSTAELDPQAGLVGDNWGRRRGADADMQLTIMNARVDFDLSVANVPAGTHLALGSAVVEVPHTGCRKFVSRFGLDAMTFVNSPTGRTLNLRGINARVVQPGSVRVGDAVRKVLSGKD